MGWIYAQNKNEHGQKGKGIESNGSLGLWMAILQKDVSF